MFGFCPASRRVVESRSGWSAGASADHSTAQCLDPHEVSTVGSKSPNALITSSETVSFGGIGTCPQTLTSQILTFKFNIAFASTSRAYFWPQQGRQGRSIASPTDGGRYSD